VNNKGFTLVELLVVVAILALLAVAVIVAINPATMLSNAKTNQAKRDVKVVADAIERCITSYLVANPTATEATAISNCYTAAQLGITTTTGQDLNKAADNSSVCFSSLRGDSNYAKYVHTAGSGGTYTDSASSKCALGV